MSDLDGTVTAVAGIVLAFLSAQLSGQLDRRAPERAATIVLRLLGLSGREAEAVARRPLPKIALARGARS